ncbi:MAG: peptidase S41, partial [Haemophilus parainfluenzae]
MKKKKWMYALSLTVMASGLIAGVQCNAATKQDKLPLKEIQTFAEVYGQVKANYYENTEDSKLVENAMKGMVSGLDPHSEYLTKEDFQGLKEL